MPQIDFIRSYSATTEGAFDRWLKRFFRLDKDSKSVSALLPGEIDIHSQLISSESCFSYQQNAIRAGFLLYEEVVDQIDYPKFFQQFNMENSFYSWFLVTEIHVWMLMVRAMAEKTVFKQLRNSIVEAMWRDVELRTKKLGHSKRSVLRKQINDLADQFEYTLIAYDEGILSDDKQMASAIWAQFFDQKCDDFTQIELMLKYVRENVSISDGQRTAKRRW